MNLSKTNNSEKGKISIKVPIREEYTSLLPFSLKSRNGIAITFSYFGDKHEVGQVLQSASHKTRAYFKNANLLQGFLVAGRVIKILKIAQANGELMEMAEEINIDIISLITYLETLENDSARIEYLGETYPDLCIFALR